MCYHISLHVNPETIGDVFPGTIFDPLLEESYHPADYMNGFDHKMVPVLLTGRKDGKRHLAPMMWGFLGSMARNFEDARRFWNGYKDETGKWKQGYITLNATGEDLLEKKMYKDAALHRRCIVFADGFYEWYHHHPIGRKGERLKTVVKYPHHIQLKDRSQPLMMFAAIWNPWRHTEVNTGTGEIQELVTPTFAIITTAANELMSRIHNSKQRMPVILNRDLAEEWIREGLTEQRIREIATWQYPSELMEAYTIAKDFQQLANPRERFEYPEWDGVFC
ncbi:MAG TPA: SOS response-associated peptidase [Chitinophagaceae bacterium]